MFSLSLRVILQVLFVSLIASVVSAQAVNSNTASVTLNATLAETLTVSATPSSVNFTLVSAGTASGSAPVAITTTWVLNTTRTAVHLYGYFAAAASALTDGGTPANNIPTANVLGQVTTGLPTAFTAFTQTGPFGGAGAGLELLNVAITGANRVATRSDNLNLQINLASLATLPAGTYTGTLTIQAQAL